MPLTNTGTDLITSLLVGAGGTVFSHANAYLGVGDSTTAFDPAQTDLQASSNFYRNAMDASFPTISGTTLVFQSTFPTGVANFTWSEWGTFNASSGGVMLNRKQESLGTKANTQAWQFQTTITISNS